jgi:hypothetical protein
MPYNKFTYEQIIKALECCANEDASCSECPLGRDYDCRQRLSLCALETINHLNEEIERITLEYAGFKAGVNHFADIGKMYSEVRADAIREFAERLKRKSYIPKPYAFLAMVDVCDIDNLVKEMTEEHP